jgi:hypothetical protein
VKTKQQQTKEVAQGLALGLISLGIDVEFTSMAQFESAFEAPWRAWDGRAAYASIGGHRFGRAAYASIGGHRFGREIYSAAAKSARWKGPVAARWEGAPMRPVEEHPDWSPKECAELVSDGAVTAAQWQELAKAVVARLSR